MNSSGWYGASATHTACAPADARIMIGVAASSSADSLDTTKPMFASAPGGMRDVSSRTAIAAICDTGGERREAMRRQTGCVRNP
jgi:hypothetical protein